jgi:hypothetical protein
LNDGERNAGSTVSSKRREEDLWSGAKEQLLRNSAKEEAEKEKERRTP